MADSHKEVVAQVLEERLRAKGLTPRRDEDGVQSGYNGLRLTPGAIQVLKQPLTKEPKFFGSVEINAALRHPAFGEVTISDMVSADAGSPDGVLALCVDHYLAVTFPPLQALFDESTYAEKPTALSGVNFQGKAVNWKAFHGQFQIVQDVTGEVAAYFQGLAKPSPLVLMMPSVAVLLSETRPHWCKIYGAQTPVGLTFGCVVDGKKMPRAEEELTRNFTFPAGGCGRWEFREFWVFLPDGEPVAADMAALRELVAAQPAQSAPAPRRSWWPFGKRVE